MPEFKTREEYQKWKEQKLNEGQRKTAQSGNAENIGRSLGLVVKKIGKVPIAFIVGLLIIVVIVAVNGLNTENAQYSKLKYYESAIISNGLLECGNAKYGIDAELINPKIIWSGVVKGDDSFFNKEKDFNRVTVEYEVKALNDLQCHRTNTTYSSIRNPAPVTSGGASVGEQWQETKDHLKAFGNDILHYSRYTEETNFTLKKGTIVRRIEYFDFTASGEPKERRAGEWTIVLDTSREIVDLSALNSLTEQYWMQMLSQVIHSQQEPVADKLMSWAQEKLKIATIYAEKKNKPDCIYHGIQAWVVAQYAATLRPAGDIRFFDELDAAKKLLAHLREVSPDLTDDKISMVNGNFDKALKSWSSQGIAASSNSDRVTSSMNYDAVSIESLKVLLSKIRNEYEQKYHKTQDTISSLDIDYLTVLISNAKTEYQTYDNTPNTELRQAAEHGIHSYLLSQYAIELVALHGKNSVKSKTYEEQNNHYKESYERVKNILVERHLIDAKMINVGTNNLIAVRTAMSLP